MMVINSERRNSLDTIDEEFCNELKNAQFGAERLPRKCVATFVLRLIKDQEYAMALKLFFKPKKPEWQLKAGKFRGICILWQDGPEVILVDSRLVERTLLYLPTIGKNRPEYVIAKAALSSILLKLLLESTEDYNDIMSSVKCKIGSAVVAARKRESYTLEALSQKQLQTLLGRQRYVLTPEGCKADAGFRPKADGLYLPIQTKSCSMGTNGKLNIFNGTSGYNNMLLLCRPMLKEPIGTLVMPGNFAPNNIGLSLTATSKYMPYVVKDIDLLQFLQSLYKAVCSHKESVCWPSGINVNIDCIRLANLESLSIPHNRLAKIEHEAYLWREAKFAEFRFERPDRLNSTVDVIIDGIRVQDKVCTDVKGRIPVSLNKSHGKANQPYHVGDFDALFVFLPCRTFFFFIPATELEKRGYLASSCTKGMQTIHVYTPRYVYRTGIRPDMWSLQFCFNSNEFEGLKRKIFELRKFIDSTLQSRLDT